MSLLPVVLTLIIIGVLLFLLNAYLPMDATIKRIINIVVIIVVVLWLVTLFFGMLPDIKIGKFK